MSTQETEMVGELLSREWQVFHVEQGDTLMRRAYKILESTAPGETLDEAGFVAIDSLVQMAVAHYTAANVKATPS